jgi:hypothetical protein
VQSSINHLVHQVKLASLYRSELPVAGEPAVSAVLVTAIRAVKMDHFAFGLFLLSCAPHAPTASQVRGTRPRDSDRVRLLVKMTERNHESFEPQGC